jgi:hypothetical protein
MTTLYDRNGYRLIDPDPLPSTRAEALQARSLHYATGRPCKRGHVATRYTPDGSCSACRALAQRVRDGGGDMSVREARAMAELLGEPSYQGRACRACGGRQRATDSGACVACASAAAARRLAGQAG